MSAKSNNIDYEDHKNKIPEEKIYKGYGRKLRKEWLEGERFVTWIEVSNRNKTKAFCKLCICEIAGRISQVERHAKTEKHCQNIRCSAQNSKMTNYLETNISSFNIKKVAAAEHNLPI